LFRHIIILEIRDVAMAETESSSDYLSDCCYKSRRKGRASHHPPRRRKRNPRHKKRTLRGMPWWNSIWMQTVKRMTSRRLKRMWRLNCCNASSVYMMFD